MRRGGSSGRTWVASATPTTAPVPSSPVAMGGLGAAWSTLRVPGAAARAERAGIGEARAAPDLLGEADDGAAAAAARGGGARAKAEQAWSSICIGVWIRGRERKAERPAL